MRFSFSFIILIGFFILLACGNQNSKSKLIWITINVNSTGKQGDAHLISKGKKHYLVDTGQKYYVESTLIPYLKNQKISVIERIFISHPHFDHYGGLQTLIESNITIHTISMNMPTKAQMDREYWGGKYSDLLDIQKSAKAHHVQIIPFHQGDKYAIDNESYVEVLYTYDGIHTPIGKTDINDMSVIMMLHHGKNNFLFTGDLNKKLGEYLGKNAKNIKADILKFPHHGTEGFAENIFFDAVHPKVVVVPGPSTLWCSERSKRARELVKKNKYEAYINGFHGHIKVISDGETYEIKTEYSPNALCK